MQIVPTSDDSVRATRAAEKVTTGSGVSWRQAMKAAIRTADALFAALDLPTTALPAARRAEKLFPVFAPQEFVALMSPGDLNDPLLRQVLPAASEETAVEGFSPDPLDEQPAAVAPGLLQKYAGRALMIVTGACAVHCRYCFRRHFPYEESAGAAQRWEPALQAIAEDDSLEEIILSGGDPLTVTDNLLAELATRLAAIPHVKRLRIHSRLPVVIPQRVTAELVSWLRGTRLSPVFVIHANHPRELSPQVTAATGRLIDAGVPVFNQAVLLRGINDNAATLTELCRQLINHRITPYYLHQLDRVAGAAHFETPAANGPQLVEQIRTVLPGYAVPQMVQEIAGRQSKTPLQ